MDSNIVPQEQREWTPRRVVQATLIVAAVLIGLYLIYRFRLVLLSLFAAIVISTAMEPALEWMKKRGVSRGVSAALIFLLILVLVVVVILLMAPLITEQGAEIVDTFGSYYSTARDWLAQSENLLLRRIGLQMPLSFPPEIQAPATDDGRAQQVATALSIGRGVLMAILYTIAIMLITFYWTMEGQTAIRSLTLFMPVENRQRARDFIDLVLEQLGKFVRGLVLLSAIVGALYLVAFIAIGIPNAVLLAIIGAVMEIIPLIGPFLGILPAFLILVALDPSRLLWLIAAFIVIQQLESGYLTPRVMKATADVNPIVTLLSLTAFGSLFGVLGAVLAIPLAMVISLVINELIFRPKREDTPVPVERDRISLLLYSARELIQDVQQLVRNKEAASTALTDHVEDAIEAIADDLVEILEQVDEQRERAA